jgi:hypothetical protein
MIRRFIAAVIFLFGALWASPILLTLFNMDDLNEISQEGAAIMFGVQSLFFVIPGLILIGIGTLVWPKKER